MTTLIPGGQIHSVRRWTGYGR